VGISGPLVARALAALDELRAVRAVEFVDDLPQSAIGTISAAAPLVIERGRGGLLVLISSTQGLTGRGGDGGGENGYGAAKHGVVGLMRKFANWLAPHDIRVNTASTPPA
jgi:NAD(P)-dependent dehydrogenase (short-subunit alcohol dehydrogenase family)